MIISGTTINIDDITIDGTSIKTLKSRLEAISADNAAAHNSHYRGKNLGTSITAAQMNAVKNGSFNDLYPGDYWALPIDGTTYAYITGCDIMPYSFASTGQAQHSTHSICVWFQNNNWIFPINDTATAAGHLINSKLYTETFPQLLAKLQAVIPAEYFNSLTEDVPDSIDSSSGKINHWARADITLFLPSQQNLGIQQASGNDAYYLVNHILWPYALNHPQTKTAGYWLCHNSGTQKWVSKVVNAAWIYIADANDTHNFAWPYAYLGIN